ncbi:MAG: peptide-modifying radical SAM enzyme CbpB [Nitrospirae bacterium GWC2_46_6]|nr:MAG: peptide-modifying radical SAM enzyme CbpB [Nitrospirae bacterium GWA2_46_11]OGW22399.1 MAG: peptide-modifying radical SAM enzyme CbpB [Nitrospirae bacterium GWC2_46_6]OGW24043.1 MAG: peptide-modifying radical SAM enzyme CbpB [Nitrospirae bacterium GWB2_47_37]HAK88636.1 peptide-modifying radical SAM enzyme CbpB [Nitrospiraceae bacterium]HBO84969.1 peptide-modifying radical SAM enzyme CbpB [Deltaproteobacteria bacterium]
MKENQRGLSFSDINTDWKLALDTDNVFWGLIPKNSDGDFMMPEDLMTLYKEKKNSLDKELYDFRFNADLNCVYIDPTDRCNANCTYCYIPAEIRKQGTQMTGPELNAALEKIAVHFKKSPKKPVIVFHAAEPLLVKDILFDSIKKFGDRFVFGIQTNALLLEKGDVEFMKKHKVGVGISLDAPDARTNNLSRVTGKGSGNFEKAVKALDWFNGYEGLNVISTVTKTNVNTLAEHVKFLHKKKVPCVLLNAVRVTQARALKQKPDEKEFAKELIRAVETAIDITKKSGRQIVVGNFANVILAIISPTARRMMCDISPCGGGRTFLTITANGDMVPCGEFIGFKEFSGGNIFKTSIEKAMDSKPFKSIRARTVEKIDECKTCDFRHICGSPCPAEMYARGNMYRKAEFCEFYKEMIKYAFKVISEDKVPYILRDGSLKQMQYEYRYA